ncbi:secondary thiamine-phosphate synthase enzyme YjbQ [Inmirania thermothiophila]|uniref:Secondary thiamine-phosphate synthase enzyme n=1 Tax=Inmirania thermothiophila TaxID=1750597 RepID=A0A3N1XWZ5_9GAMM|nr:secondary thiamine-phosphate synthase enzyme YjbQ [Inmirania thermothiophila]ROR29722.1 secondary thiamine-phosphate synthase enzyme [Inmirania thermothiophila]
MSDRIEVETPAHQALVPITRAVQARIEALGLREGAVHLFCEHTTCGLLVNENADPDVARDLIARLERLVPWDDPRDRHAEGNTAAHLRAVLVGCDLTIPVRQGRLALGTWQGIFLAEFDGPRRRRIRLTPLPPPTR